MKIMLLSVVLVICYTQAHAFNATAVFSSQGIAGWIRFTQTPTGVQIVVNLDGLTANASWTLHQLPVLTTLDPTQRGLDENVGPVFDNFDRVQTGECNTATPEACMVGDFTSKFGVIPAPGGTRIVNDTGILQLTGINSIMGRSVVVTSGTTTVAASIINKLEEKIPPATVRVYTATFFSPVAGTIYFRQVENLETAIYGKLYHVTDSGTTTDHAWAVNTFGPPIGYQQGLGCTTNVIGDIFNDVTGSDPALGDLSARFDTLSVSAAPTPLSENAFYFTDDVLTLSGQFTILGRSVTVFNSGDDSTILACAPIVESESLSVTQFDEFLLIMTQNSPYENTTLIIGEDYPDNDPGVSIFQDAFMVNGFCTSPAATYNPFEVAVDTSPERGMTPDQFPLGDIPNKYNLDFFGPNELELTDLPLYGPNTLTSRTIQVATEVDGNTVTTCSALVPPKGGDGVLVKATFSSDSVKGGVYFIQNPLRDGSFYLGATNVVVDLYYNSSDASTTMGHNWIISPATCDQIDSGADPTVFNPFEVVRDSAECSSLNQLRCENGDMSGKHTTLKLSALSPSRVTYSFMDINLQLSQNYSISGQSLVIMGPEGSSDVLACSTLPKLELNEQANDIFFSTPATGDFDRVAFLNMVTSGDDQLRPMLDPSNVIVLDQVVGDIFDSDTPCASFQMVLMAPRTDIANTYADITQRSLCRRFADDPCFRQLTDACEGFGSGSTTVKSTVILGAMAVLLAWISM